MDVQNYFNLIKKGDLDIRLEILLLELLIQGERLSQIEIQSLGGFDRNYKKDVEKLEYLEGSINQRERIRFWVNRDGLYDGIPEDLFHQPSEKITENSNKESTLQEMHYQRDIENTARSFFFPIEQEYFRLKLKLENEERKYIFHSNEDLPLEVFEDLWELPDFFTSSQRKRLGVFFPILHKIVGDSRLIQYLLETVMEDRVQIKESLPLVHSLEELTVMGESYLGRNTALGGKLSTMIFSNRVIIYYQNYHPFTDYLPGGKIHKAYEFLCTLLFPIEIDFNIEINLSNTEFSFILEDKSEFLGRLNFTTLL